MINNFYNRDPLKHTIQELIGVDISHCYHDGEYLYLDDLKEEFPNITFNENDVVITKHKDTGEEACVLHEDDFLRDLVCNYTGLTEDVMFMLKSYMKYGYYLDDDAIKIAWGILETIDADVEAVLELENANTEEILEAWYGINDLSEFEAEKENHKKKYRWKAKHQKYSGKHKRV